jgi:hypothetical protein
MRPAYGNTRTRRPRVFLRTDRPPRKKKSVAPSSTGGQAAVPHDPAANHSRSQRIAWICASRCHRLSDAECVPATRHAVFRRWAARRKRKREAGSWKQKIQPHYGEDAQRRGPPDNLVFGSRGPCSALAECALAGCCADDPHCLRARSVRALTAPKVLPADRLPIVFLGTKYRPRSGACHRRSRTGHHCHFLLARQLYRCRFAMDR